MNLPKFARQQDVIKVLRLLAVAGSAISFAGALWAIALGLSGNRLSALAAETQPGNSGRTFADWCRAQASLSPETKHTVEVLLKQAETNDCDAANQKLSSETELNLSNNKISDLKPLQGMTNLTGLLLNNNQISDLKPLQGMTNLTGLSLYNNQISDIKPLQGMTKLNRLYLGNNKISDIKPLQGMTKLTELYLSGNPIAPKICPLKPESICKWEPLDQP